MRRGDSVNELVRTEVKLASLGVLDSVSVEAGLGLRRELLGLFRADERLLDGLFNGCDFRHSVLNTPDFFALVIYPN